MNFNPPTSFMTRDPFVFPDLSLPPAALTAQLPPRIKAHLDTLDPSSCWLVCSDPTLYTTQETKYTRLPGETAGDLNFSASVRRRRRVVWHPTIKFNCCHGKLKEVLLWNLRLMRPWQKHDCTSAHRCMNPWHGYTHTPWRPQDLEAIYRDPTWAFPKPWQVKRTPREFTATGGLPNFAKIARLPLKAQTTKSLVTWKPQPEVADPLPELDLTPLLPDLIELAHSFSTRDEALQALQTEGYPDQLINQALDAVRRFQT